jgi:phosphoribosylaminoimidazole-succinocarboxamide synthase
LNLTSAHWFHASQHIIGNHLIDIPHPNVAIVRKSASHFQLNSSCEVI